jgi:hypothetical protein
VLKRWGAWSRGTRWVLGGIAAVVVVLAVAWVLFVPAADWLATHDVGSVSGPLRTVRLQAARDAARGRLLTLGAGLFAVGALIYTARNFTLSREGQVTDRYTKAIEQLGSDKLDVRIGGIYALERVARDSAKDHSTVMEVLAAFVREHSREQWPPLPDEPGADAPKRITRPDVQAALTVIGRRDSRHDEQPIDLGGADLTRALLGGADFVSANLSSATLTGANLAKAVLASADLSATMADGANLRGANLSGANLIATFLADGADLTGADLTGADLTGATLLRAILNDADLTGAHLYHANLERADLTGAHLTGAHLTGADLTGAIFREGQGVPEGWMRDSESGRLKRTNRDADDSGN